MIEAVIQRLDAWLRANRPAYYQLLQPGLTAQEFESFQSKLKLKMPEPFRDFYLWRNGQKVKSFEAFQHNFGLMSTKQILGAKRDLDELLEAGDFEGPNWWNTKWVPFLDNGGGDHFCIDLAGTFTKRPGQVLWFLHDDGERSVEYAGFAEWLTTFVDALE